MASHSQVFFGGNWNRGHLPPNQSPSEGTTASTGRSMAIEGASAEKGFQDARYRALIGQLVEARKAKNLSQQALATQLGRHRQFVSRCKIGERCLDTVELSM
jgi:ribosome-binding protein aMBF1 (putative translation factor)